MKTQTYFDSHVHFQATGENILGLRLGGLQSPSDVAKLEILPRHFRGRWLVGFGWDENNWPGKELPNRHLLDQVFPNTPVVFTRADGHSSWVNQAALVELDLHDSIAIEQYREFLPLDDLGKPSGILREKAHIEVLMQLPQYTEEQIQEFLLKAQELFLKEGITHIRDMGSDLRQFEISRHLESQGLLNLFVIHNFACENLLDFPRVLSDCLHAKSLESQQLKVAGIKVYLDGSLGSSTALLSRDYNEQPGNRGLLLWSIPELQEVIRRTWEAGLEISVHTIGDEAADLVVSVCRELSAKGLVGILNLEHCEVLRPETIQKMKSLHVRCHIQPCHYLSDRRWLREKLGELYQYVFPWEALRLAKVPVFFGSDSPIEYPSIEQNRKALQESAKDGIREFRGDFLQAHTCYWQRSKS